MTAPFRTRISKVRFKRGGEVVLLPSQDDAKWHKHVLSRIRVCLDAQEYVAGFIFVAWDKNSQSVADIQVRDSIFPQSYIPEFVKARIHGELVEGWVKESGA